MTAPMLNVAATFTMPVPPIAIVSNEQLQGLRFDWTVQKRVGPEPDSAQVTIYNLSVVLRKAFENARGLGLPTDGYLSIGWGMVPQLVFAGSVWKVRPEVKDGVDVRTEIELTDGGLALRDTGPLGGSWVGATAAMLAQLLLGALRLVPSPTALPAIQEAAAKLPLKTWTASGEGTPRKQLDDLMSTLGLSWGIENNNIFVVYRAGLRNDVPPLILAPESGLLMAHALDDGGVEFEALAQPMAVPGQQVTFLVRQYVAGGYSTKPLGGGPLRIESVTFSGSSQGPSTMTGVARKVQIL